ncbi:nitrilase-related carbon-nitrogen hydrolase [Colwellia psychrerythraea]|uniref:Nitrilase/cyanide hydratase and apolipoprotein N-acyltransferase n=1 Tax=Colwellia psychrerythraea TaxID=28229 RepID=A0A099KEA5_COLPS|nr:nitrilase-related carbon-nitrogen hydrolase [Colwellia psychrerythraea]KGJ88661.1 Nitrilase/cyanide hydratase and apolipoprotein N-acyltransferase [Colwellia psychrerythraea]
MRVAVSQFATSSNFQENLASCIRIINEAATCKPTLIVLPEYCNTQFYNAPIDSVSVREFQSGYVDHNQSWDEALPLGGEFLQKIAQQAKKHHCYIVANVTLRRDLTRGTAGVKQDGSVKSKISVTSCLFSPLGDLIIQTDKQKLTDDESKFFTSVTKESEVVTTPFGQLGLLVGNDSMSFEPSRNLALKGAQLLCNSINTIALDQCSLHDPARAFENKIFIASANKVAPLIPSEQSEEHLTETNSGAGRSQILSVEGKVLAKITHNEEGFTFADIGLLGAENDKEIITKAGLNDKHRPDGTLYKDQLRPELYQELTAAITQTHKIKTLPECDNTKKLAVTANVAIFATYKTNEQAIEDVCHYIENNLTDIIQLPELFFVTDKTITKDIEQRVQIENLSKNLIEQVSSVLRPFQYLCTSLLIDGVHQAVLINQHGLFARQEQLHFCQRYQWTALGNELTIVDIPLEQGNITLAMLTADDANMPEIVEIAALNGIQLLLVPFDIQESCEVDYSLLSRAAENRICIVAASREKSFANDLPSNNTNDNIYSKNKVKAQKSTGLIANLSTDPALLPQWRARPYSGYINQPLVKLQYGKITKAVIHPIAACRKY